MACLPSKPYDFIIEHRPGLSNPADGLSSRPDSMAQRKPSLVQLDLMQQAVELNESLVQLDSLCNTVKCQLCDAVGQPKQL